MNEAIERVFELLCEHCPSKNKGHCIGTECDELVAARARLAEIEAKPRVQGIENLGLILEYCDNEGKLDPRQIEAARAELAQLVPIGALRTLAIEDDTDCFCCSVGSCKDNKSHCRANLHRGTDGCIQERVAYAIAHPTEEGK